MNLDHITRDSLSRVSWHPVYPCTSFPSRDRGGEFAQPFRELRGYASLAAAFARDWSRKSRRGTLRGFFAEGTLVRSRYLPFSPTGTTNGPSSDHNSAPTRLDRIPSSLDRRTVPALWRAPTRMGGWKGYWLAVTYGTPSYCARRLPPLPEPALARPPSYITYLGTYELKSHPCEQNSDLIIILRFPNCTSHGCFNKRDANIQLSPPLA